MKTELSCVVIFLFIIHNDDYVLVVTSWCSSIEILKLTHKCERKAYCTLLVASVLHPELLFFVIFLFIIHKDDYVLHVVVTSWRYSIESLNWNTSANKKLPALVTAASVLHPHFNARRTHVTCSSVCAHAATRPLVRRSSRCCCRGTVLTAAAWRRRACSVTSPLLPLLHQHKSHVMQLAVHYM